jgi:ferredoxin
MEKVKRQIIKINEELCTGCGDCIPACPEQALQIVETPNGPKARLVKEIYCDGLGACLGVCPTGALTITEEEVEPYNDDATVQHIRDTNPDMLETHVKHIIENARKLHKEHDHQDKCACSSAKVIEWQEEKKPAQSGVRAGSQLRQWPVQINLVPPSAPYLKGADIVIIADCVPFAYANLHQDFLKDNVVLVGCPKFDDAEAYIDKITQIIKQARPKSLQVVHMEVPCCHGLTNIVKEAVRNSGNGVSFKKVIIGIKGERQEDSRN